jgi:glycosyltransferase involved in cell wall biosynthesis
VRLAQAPPETGVLDVSVVLPCCNERDHVELEVKRIRAALEAIVGIRAILLPRNQGSGTARRIGTQQARGRVVVWTDADLTYPNERIPEPVAELDGTYDQVVGARRTRGRDLQAGPGAGQVGHPQAGLLPHPRSGDTATSAPLPRRGTRYALR